MYYELFKVGRGVTNKVFVGEEKFWLETEERAEECHLKEKQFLYMLGN